MNKQIVISLPENEREFIRTHAFERRIKMNALIALALEAYREKWRIVLDGENNEV